MNTGQAELPLHLQEQHSLCPVSFDSYSVAALFIDSLVQHRYVWSKMRHTVLMTRALVGAKKRSD